MDGLTRRQALTATAAAARCGRAAPDGPAAARGRHGAGGDHGDGHGPKRVAPPLTLTGAKLLDPGERRGHRGRDDRVRAGDRPARRAAANGPRRAGVIDVGGAFVLPGLIDVHVHAATVAAAQSALAKGATTVRSASTAFFQDVGLRAMGEVGGLGMPRVLPAGLFVTPNLGDSLLADPRLAPLAALPDGVRSPEALRFLTQVNIARGARGDQDALDRARRPARAGPAPAGLRRAPDPRGGRRRAAPARWRARATGTATRACATRSSPACARSSTARSPRRRRST